MQQKNNIVKLCILLLVIVAATQLLNGAYGSPGVWIVRKLEILPGIILGLTFHEFGHAAVSTMLGDPTPKAQGRLSLNPLRHIDWIGFLCLMFAGFGWGIPVQIDPRYYKHRRSGELLVSLAGVVMNLILAVLVSLLIHVLLVTGVITAYAQTSWQSVLFMILYYIVSINIVLMIFNLLPVPPLDGFGIVTQIFDLRKYPWYESFYQFGMPLLLLLIIFNVTDLVLTPLCSGLLRIFTNHIMFAGMSLV